MHVLLCSAPSGTHVGDNCFLFMYFSASQNKQININNTHKNTPYTQPPPPLHTHILSLLHTQCKDTVHIDLCSALRNAIRGLFFFWFGFRESKKINQHEKHTQTHHTPTHTYTHSLSPSVSHTQCEDTVHIGDVIFWFFHESK